MYIVYKLPSSPEVYATQHPTPFCGANHLVRKLALLGGACLFVRSPKGQAKGKVRSSSSRSRNAWGQPQESL